MWVWIDASQYSLAWTLAQPAMSSLIAGVTKLELEHLQDGIVAADIVFPPEHFPEIDAICPPPWRQFDPIRG